MTETFRSFAKINLHLQVDGRFSDGYHELRTIFQTVSLHDLVSLAPSDRPAIELSVPGGGAPADASNLAYRAARALLDFAAPQRGLVIELHKRIPAGGGLGGGSSNAAAVLLGAREVLDLDVADSDLQTLAAGLGADVPYFLVGGTALGTGRGDAIEPLVEIPQQEILLVDPGVSVSTAGVFAGLELQPLRPLPVGVAMLVAGEPAADIESLRGFNDLEKPVFEAFPRVRSVYNALRRAGASMARLSGSGATVFACFADSQQASEARTHLPSDAKVYEVRTLSRSRVREARSVEVGEGESNEGD